MNLKLSLNFVGVERAIACKRILFVLALHAVGVWLGDQVIRFTFVGIS